MTMIQIMIFALIAVMFAFALWVGADRHEITECLTWQDQAEQYGPLFYLTEWQAEQCAAHGIEVDAPVIKTQTQWKEKH